MNLEGFTKIPNSRLKEIIDRSDCQTAIILALESRRGYTEKSMTLGMLIDTTAKSGKPRAATTFSEALKALESKGEIFQEAGRFFVRDSIRDSDQKAVRKAVRDSARKAVRDSVKTEGKNIVSDDEKNTLTNGSNGSNGNKDKRVLEISTFEPSSADALTAQNLESEVFEEEPLTDEEFAFLSESETTLSHVTHDPAEQEGFPAAAEPVDNFVDNSSEPQKSVPKKEKTPKAPKAPKPAGNQTRGLLASALGGYGALQILINEIAKVDRKAWLEIPLERAAELKKLAVEQTEVGKAPKWTLVKLLDAEINPERGIAIPRASPGQGRPQNALEAAQRLSEGQNAALEHYRRTRGVQA